MAQDGDELVTAENAAQAPAPAPSGDRRRPLDAAARARIGRGLRLHYAALLAEPVPDHLRALLDDLAARADRESPQ